MKIQHLFQYILVAALLATWQTQANDTNVIVSGRAYVDLATGGADYVGAQTNKTYLKVKYPSATDCSKAYLEFDLAGRLPNTNATARVVWRTISNSGAQRLQLWALNQSSSGPINDITWNNAPANNTTLSTDNAVPLMLTNGPATATLLSEANYAGGTQRPSTDLPANWGQYIVGNKLVIAITSPTNSYNNSAGYRIDFTNSVSTNLPTLFFTDLLGALPPTITTTTNQTAYEYHPVGPISFTVDDLDSGAGAVLMSAVSDDTNVVPNNFSFTTVSPTIRTLNFTCGSAGNAQVRVWASDGVQSNSTAFTVTVLRDPEITSPGGSNTLIGTAATGTYTVSDVDDPTATSLTTSAKSLDLGVILDANVSTAGTGASRTVSATPTVGDGVGTVQVTVSDGTHSNSTLFAVMALPNASVYFSDHFSYPNATGQSYNQLLEAAGGLWRLRGSAGSVSIRTTNSSAMIRSSSSGESLIGPLAGGPYSTGTLYYGFKATWLSMPAHSEADFIHLYDGSVRVARIATDTNGPATDSFLLKFGNASTSALGAGAPTNVLTTNVTYTIVMRHDVINAISGYPESRLWINPASESDYSFDAVDSSTPGLAISHVGLRQNLGMGTILIDDLKVGASFSDVLPTAVVPPVVQSAQYTGGTFQITFTGAVSDSATSFKLLTATAVDGPYTASNTAEITRIGTNLFKATHVTGASQRYYRIQR